jgi:hypothetical protein
MTERRVYLATTGPFIFDDTEDLDSYETGVLAGRKQAALTTDGSVLVADGGDVTLEGSDDNPSKILFTTGADKTSFIGISAAETDNPRSLSIYPDTHGQGHVFFGGLAGALNPLMIRTFAVYTCLNGITLNAYTDDTYPGAKSVTVNVVPATSNSRIYEFEDTGLTIDSNKAIDIGEASYAFDDVYADDFQNVADFYNLDTKDDLATLDQIKGSGKLDKNGLELIDDDTLPEWMLTKDKHTGDIARDLEGKPYLSMRMVTSLVMGACRQLNKKVSELESKLELLAVIKN